MPDLFANLLPMSWRGISFPTANFRVSISQDIVQHKFAQRDGAHLEATGREPIIYTAKLLFRNHIARGPTERWQVPLYPDAWRRMVLAASDRSTGELQHPEFGKVQCKLHKFDTVWTADMRDGVDVDVEWIETTDAGADGIANIAKLSALQVVNFAALELDVGLTVARTPVPSEAPGDLAKAFSTFSKMANGLQSTFDQATLFQRRVTGKIDSLIYRSNLVVDSLTRAAGPRATQVAKNAVIRNTPLKNSAQRVSVGAHDLKQELNVRAKDVSVYVTPQETTITALSRDLARTTNCLMILNPRLVSRPTVAAQSRVRFWTNASDDAVAA